MWITHKRPIHPNVFRARFIRISNAIHNNWKQTIRLKNYSISKIIGWCIVLLLFMSCLALFLLLSFAHVFYKFCFRAASIYSISRMSVSFRWFITNASGKIIINCRMCLNFVSNSIHMAQDSLPQFFTLAWEFLLLIWSDLIWADWEYLKCCHKVFEWLSSYLSILFKLTQINHFHYQCVYFCIIFFAVYPQKQPPYPYGHGGYPQMYPIHNMYHGSQYGPYNY